MNGGNSSNTTTPLWKFPTPVPQYAHHCDSKSSNAEPCCYVGGRWSHQRRRSRVPKHTTPTLTVHQIVAYNFTRARQARRLDAGRDQRPARTVPRLQAQPGRRLGDREDLRHRPASQHRRRRDRRLRPLLRACPSAGSSSPRPATPPTSSNPSAPAPTRANMVVADLIALIARHPHQAGRPSSSGSPTGSNRRSATAASTRSTTRSTATTTTRAGSSRSTSAAGPSSHHPRPAGQPRRRGDHQHGRPARRTRQAHPPRLQHPAGAPPAGSARAARPRRPTTSRPRSPTPSSVAPPANAAKVNGTRSDRSTPPKHSASTTSQSPGRNDHARIRRQARARLVHQD